MYNVNGGVPEDPRARTWSAGSPTATPRGRSAEVLDRILDTPVSPELIPPGADGAIVQKTEEILGPYELHDFFLWALLRLGAGPRKILFLADHAFEGRYDDADASSAGCASSSSASSTSSSSARVLPDGPKVGSVSLSPRGDWRMPCDASKAAWLRELE